MSRNTSEWQARAAQNARQLGVGHEARELYLDSDVIDLHIDSFIWHRVFGYDLRRRHGRGLLQGLCYSQADIPRVLDAGITGATWVITTNPARDARGRAEAFEQNLRELTAILEEAEGVQLCTTAADYRAAKRSGKHAAYLGIQGGNALDRRLDDLVRVPAGLILRITLVHLSSSTLGDTSSPGRLLADRGLTPFGKAYVERLNEINVFVDLAHISKKGFWDAVAVHDKNKPFIVSHTGVSGVHQHWRNLDDDQLRAVADSGGLVGIMYHSAYLGDPLFSGRAESIALHLEHAMRIAGADHVGLGSDWDGAICTPKDMRTCSELPLLVEILLQRGWPADNVRKVLGLNFLRVLEQLRG